MVSVLIVDDSALVRKLASNMLSSDSEIEVIGAATNGLEGVDKAKALKPDVVLLDVQMPIMDGIEALKHIVKETDCSVVMFSSLTKENAEITLDALEIGAVDFITKPSAVFTDMELLKYELISKVKAAKGAKKFKTKAQMLAISHPSKESHFSFSVWKKKAIVVASSTGGPATLERIIPKLDSMLPVPVFVVQHMPPGFTKTFSERLNSLSSLPVKEAEEGEEVKKGTVYIAPGGFHMVVRRANLLGAEKEFITLTLNDPVLGLRPYANYTINSVAEIYRENTVCIILTGMGDDGTEGAKLVKTYGGKVFSEDEKDCIIYGMPKAAVTAKVVDEVIPLDSIALKMMESINDK